MMWITQKVKRNDCFEALYFEYFTHKGDVKKIKIRFIPFRLLWY